MLGKQKLTLEPFSGDPMFIDTVQSTSTSPSYEAAMTDDEWGKPRQQVD